jgi:hypothetical protein
MVATVGWERVVRQPPAAESKRRKKKGIKINISGLKNYFLRSISFEILSQMKGNLINNCDLF